jgi:D-alanyl-D-alanine carboxypeptidase
MPGRPRLVAAIAGSLAIVVAVGLVTGYLSVVPPGDPSAVAAAATPAPAAVPSAAATGTPPASPTPSPTATRPDPRPTATPPGTAPTPEPAAPSANAALARRLSAALVRYRERQAIPGISVTMIFADGTTWTDAAGFSVLRDASEVTEETEFPAASMSKTFVAAAVLRLVEDGRIRLDEPVGARLPALGLDRRITIRMLLEHTSGLRDFFFHPRIDRALLAAPDAEWTPQRSLRYVGKPYFRPGRGWHYSNTNYLVLGLLVEAVTGRPLATVIRREFLDPLRLEDTYTQGVEKPRGPTAHGYRYASGAAAARPVDVNGGTVVMPFRSVVTAAAGAGGIASTSGDLARWARALYGGSVLEPTSLAQMIDASDTAPFQPRIAYGLGTQAVSIDGRPAVGHSGRFLGFRGVMRWLPNERIAIVVLTNQSRRDPAVVARQLLRVVFGPPPKPSPSTTPSP